MGLFFVSSYHACFIYLRGMVEFDDFALKIWSVSFILSHKYTNLGHKYINA